MSSVTCPKALCLVDVSELDKFVNALNQTRKCNTAGCNGSLVPTYVKRTGLGGALLITYTCGGCNSQSVLFKTSSVNVASQTSEISRCVQVAFIISGATYATYFKTLHLALGIEVVSMPTFMATIKSMFPVVKEMLNEMCELAKNDMKKKADHDLGSWKCAVTCADGVWHKRKWHSKNATFTVRNYFNGALLYYMHLCHKGRDNVIQEELYAGTSKSAEGFAARIIFKRAKEEGMQIAIHWQDADSSSSNAVSECFPEAEIMVCGGHVGRAHRKQLEARATQKKFTDTMMSKYEKTFPGVKNVTCHCIRHKVGCGCLSESFIAKAHTNFTSILMECKSQEEFVRRITALPKHARDEHVWEGGRCDFHPLSRAKLSCPFHSLAYEIECYERVTQVKKIVHPVLLRGHSNAVEASHNVLIRFRSKDIFLERLHYELSTNLGLLQANLTYMHNKLGTSYHWIPELYHRMHLPVFDGVQEALEMHSIQRKKALEEIKTEEAKKNRVQWKIERTKDAERRKIWSKKHGRDTYGHEDDDVDHCAVKMVVRDIKNPQNKGKCKACGSRTHLRSNKRDCPYNKNKSKKDGLPQSPECFEDVIPGSSEEDDVTTCTCGAYGRAHRKDCSLKHYAFSLSSDSLSEPEVESALRDNINAPPSKKTHVCTLDLGDKVCFHRMSLGKNHVACRIVRKVGERYQLFCSQGIIDTPLSAEELIPLTTCSLSLDKWRSAPMVSLRNIVDFPLVLEPCSCVLPESPEHIVLSPAEGVSTGIDTWVRNDLYSLTRASQSEVTSPTGWLADEVITAAQLLILQYFPNMAGLQPPTLQQTCTLQVHSGEFVQIIHVGNNHWCVVSTVGCKTGEVNVYDSLCGNLSFETELLIASMISCSVSSELTVRVMNVDRQKNGSDCGVLAIAYVFDICSGLDPCAVKFDHKSIRQHLATCLENCQFSRFPVLGDRRKSRSKVTLVKLYCSCRLPVKEGAELMVQCDKCSMWYHPHCIVKLQDGNHFYIGIYVCVLLMKQMAL